MRLGGTLSNIVVLVLVVMVVVVALAFLLDRFIPTREEKVQKHSVYFEKTTPDGQRIPCIAINEDAIACKFP